MGLKHYAILSNGTENSNPKFSSTLEKKLVDAQRILSRRTKGGSNWHKQCVKVARIQEKISNARNDYLQKVSAQIVKNYDIIGIEGL